MPKTMANLLLRPVVVTRILAGVLALGLLVLAGQASFSSSSPATYVVRAGDNLWTIATSRHLTVSQLSSANGLNPSAVLRIGTRLTLPSSAAAVATSAQGTSSAPSVASSSASNANFCATFSPLYDARGVLPSSLRANSSRLALRPIFVSWAQRYGVSPALVEAIAWQESGWQEGVVSSASAVGVGQLLPSTATFVSQSLLGRNLNINTASDNIQMEARYLAYLQGNLGGTCATVAGYYEGLQNMHRYGVLGESQAYVASVEAMIPSFS
ncbi:MAG: LysM peptidoglycan-binding domain-containing protein [Actinomycetota bacterium]|nr:LysM peptidoglycan-binding domain-containing protein [Actinomycetota bacterium]